MLYFRKFDLFRVILLCTFLFVSTSKARSNEVEKEKTVESVNLQLKWTHQFQFAGYYAAKEMGFYAEEGLDVHFTEFDQQKSIVKQVLLGHANYGVGDIGIFLNYAEGASITALAAIFQHNPLVFISKKSSEIISPFEMLGKRVMLEHTATDEAPLRAILNDAEISKSQYIAVKHSYNIEDFVSGKVDVLSGYITNEPFEIKQRGIEINIINPQSYGIDFYSDILFTSDQEIENNPGRAKRFLRATIKGWKYAFEHSEEVIQLINNKYKSRSNIEQLRHEAEEMRKLVLPDTIPIGQITEARLRNVADIYNRLNLVRTLTDSEISDFMFVKPNKLNLNETELTWLQDNPVIRLGVAKDFMPYQWINEYGEFDGIAADYIKLLEQRLGIKFEINEEKESWLGVLEAVKRNDLDMLACAVKTPSREGYLNFSKPYLSSTAVIISEQSNGYIGSLKKLKGKHIAIQKGNYTQELLAKDYPDITIILTKNIKDALSKVSTGQAYAYVGDVTAATHVMKKEGFLNLVFSGSTPYQSEFSLAVDKNKPILSSIINKGLASISESERNDIYNHWRALKVTQGVDVDTIIKYAFGVLGLFIIFSYWVYRLRLSEADLLSSEAKLQLILDTDPECVQVIDADGHLVQMNPAGLKMFGVEEGGGIIGQQAGDFVVDEYRQAFDEMNLHVLKGETRSLEYKIMRLNGIVRFVESNVVPLVDEKNKTISILAVTSDITEQKKINEVQKIASLVYQNSSDAMMVLDKANLVIAINPAFAKITGYTFQEVKGKNPKILLFNNENNSLDREMKDAIKKSGRWEGEIWSKRKSGELYPLRVIINTIFIKGNIVDQRVVLFSDITEQKEAEKVIWNQANFDHLTGLPNRNMLLGHLDQDIKVATRSGNCLAVIFLDLDHFKEVNDTLGHAGGDELLRETAERLKSSVRESDTVARLGGDEFIIVLADLEGTHNIDKIALNIIKELSAPFQINNEQAYVSASLGISLYPNDAEEGEGLIKYADKAMYLSKQRGRGCFSYFTQSMQEQANSRIQLLNSIRRAIIKEQFELYYQPIVDLTTGEIVKAEALIRWNHPTRGIVEPAEFVSICEESGLIIEIGDWVYKQASQQVKLWRDIYNKNLQVSINKSPVQFRAATDRDGWLNYLKEIGLEGDGIAIEITEGLLMDDATNITYQLLQYRDAGIQVSLDDFGTGYSALSYLNKFDIDYLKIDRSFTKNLSLSSNDLALSEAIIVMSHKLGLKVITEGIETESQRQLIHDAGCNYGQGFLFSKPVPAQEFEQLLESKFLMNSV